MALSNDFSYLSSSDNTFIDGLYRAYQKSPDSVEESWKMFFRGVDFALAKPEAAEGSAPSAQVGNWGKELKVFNLINGYRARGHLLSKTNPIRERKNRFPHLDLVDFGLTDADLNEKFAIGETIGKAMPL